MSPHAPNRPLLAAALLASIALPAMADVPRVAVDIAPVHALVAQVMGDLGAPDLILPPNASPHGYAMRPSEARSVEAADLVIWMGEGLTPALGRAIERLAGDTARIDLLEVAGITTYGFRTDASFETHDHGDDHGDEHEDEDHGHGDGHDHGHDEHGHGYDDEEHGHDDHGHADHDHGDHHEAHGHENHDHAHDDVDPHAWLDPANARVWLPVIAAELGALDPENAATYAANADVAATEIAALEADIAADLAGLSERSFIVFHDAYIYFEERFGLQAAGAISLSDASAPGPARVVEIRDQVAELDAVCVFAEPQFNTDLVTRVFEGTNVTLGIIDPLGSAQEVGPGHYAATLRAMAESVRDCL